MGKSKLMPRREKKPFWKKGWFWAIIIIFGVFSAFSEDEETTAPKQKEIKAEETAAKPKESEKPKEKKLSAAEELEKIKKEEEAKEKKKSEETAKKANGDQLATVDLQTYLEENFFMTSWYELIEMVNVSGNEVTVKTSVFGDDEGKEATKGLVSSIWGFINTNDSDYDFSQIKILDKEGNTIVSEKNPLH